MITINGTDIATPTKFTIERYPLVAKSGRVASGKMTADLLGWKRKFNLEYTVLSGDDLDTIMSLVISETDFFFTFGYFENGFSKTATCYIGAIPTDLFRSDTWQWTNVSFSLIEQ